MLLEFCAKTKMKHRIISSSSARFPIVFGQPQILELDGLDNSFKSMAQRENLLSCSWQQYRPDHLIMWEIWLMRNDCSFNQGQVSPINIIQDATSLQQESISAFLKQRNLSRTKSTSGKDIPSQTDFWCPTNVHSPDYYMWWSMETKLQVGSNWMGRLPLWGKKMLLPQYLLKLPLLSKLKLMLAFMHWIGPLGIITRSSTSRQIAST